MGVTCYLPHTILHWEGAKGAHRFLSTTIFSFLSASNVVVDLFVVVN